MSQVNQQRYGCYIGNIDRSVTLEVLRQVFSQCGAIIDCSLNGRDEDPYRYGFIDFATEDDRARAMKYNGFTLAGRKIKVGVSKGNVGRPDSTITGSNNNHTNTQGNNNNTNTANNNNQPPPQQPQQPSQIPAVPLAAGFLPGVMQQQQQQQQSAQLLMQLIQQGVIDVNNLTPEQQQILMTSLLPQAGPPPPVPGMPAMPQAPQMSYPPMQQAWGAVRGGGNAYGGPQMGRGMPYNRGPANPMPSEETVKLREVQRKQFLEVVRREAEKYERKLRERGVKEGRAASLSGSDESSSSDEGDKRRHGQGKREDDDGETERGKKAKTHRAEADHNHHNQQNSNSAEGDNGVETQNDNAVGSPAGASGEMEKIDDKIELEEPREVESSEGVDDREKI